MTLNKGLSCDGIKQTLARLTCMSCVRAGLFSTPVIRLAHGWQDILVIL